MSNNAEHTITFVKQSQRRLRAEVIESNFAALIASVNNKSMTVKGWTVDSDYRFNGPAESAQAWLYGPGQDGFEHRYIYALSVNFSSESRKPQQSDFEYIVNRLCLKAQTPALGSWSVDTLDGRPFTYSPEAAQAVPEGSVEYTEVSIPANWDDYFSHLFGLDANVKRIRGALEIAIDTGFSDRFHCALIGPPGCGKSDICRSVKRALGEDAVWELDGTAMTSAGAIKELVNLEILPRVMVIEEIEKANEDALRFLLALCDTRGEIRKVTARDNVQKETKLFVIATVNDFNLFKELQKKALASRFANKIFFKRPSRDMRALILEREIRKLPNGDMRWIQPALDFCDDLGIDDPREIIAHCLCGRDLLLTGEYQEMVKATNEDSANGELTLESPSF